MEKGGRGEMEKRGRLRESKKETEQEEDRARRRGSRKGRERWEDEQETRKEKGGMGRKGSTDLVGGRVMIGCG